MVSGEPGTGRPILHRRGASRASVIGLEPQFAQPASRAVVPRVQTDDGSVPPVQRPVVAPRPVAPIAELLRSAPADRIASVEQPPAMEITSAIEEVPAIEVGPPLEFVSADVFEMPLPARPPMEDIVFADDDYLVETFEAEEKRGRFVVITVRRVLAVTALTAALVAGSGAWVAASSPTVEPAAASTTHKASTEHDK